MSSFMIRRFRSGFVVAAVAAVSLWVTIVPPVSATDQSTTSCQSPPALTHSIVLFGGSGTDYVSSNHTFGSAGDMYGLAIDGSAQFPNYSTSFTSSGITNYITGGWTGMRPTANGGSWSSTGFPYNQQAWIDYANALADAAEADPAAYPKVRVYRLDGGTMSITNDGPDYPNRANQTLHVAVGSGTLRTTQTQNDKTDGAILAPEALVDVNKQIHHIHGWVVAKRFVESYAVNGGNINNTGLQVHGQNPDALVEVCTTSTTTTSTVAPTTTTVAPTTTTVAPTTTTTVAPTTTTTSVPQVSPPEETSSTTTSVPQVSPPEESAPAQPSGGAPSFTG